MEDYKKHLPMPFSYNYVTEVWLPVKDYEGLYEVSNLGRVKNAIIGKILKQKIDRYGYLHVCLYKGVERKKTYMVHRLVAQAFLGDCPDGYEVDHINTIRDGNMLCNLRYVTRKEQFSLNETTKQRKAETVKNPEWRKRHAEACKKALSKPVNQFTLDGQFVRTWACTREAERELGFAHSAISKCCLGKYKQAYGSIWRYKNEEGEE